MPDVWPLLFGAFALMLVFEGVLPFASPARWRQIFEQATRLTDGQLRFMGLVCMLLGGAALLVFLS